LITSNVKQKEVVKRNKRPEENWPQSIKMGGLTSQDTKHFSKDTSAACHIMANSQFTICEVAIDGDSQTNMMNLCELSKISPNHMMAADETAFRSLKK